MKNNYEYCDNKKMNDPPFIADSYIINQQKKDRHFTLQKIILLVFIIFLVISPLCFILPDFSVEKISPEDSKTEIYEITIHNKMPVKIVSANIDNHIIPVTRTEDNKYTVEPNINGIMEIKVTLINRQYISKTTDISGIDIDSPVLLNQEKTDDGTLILYLKDTGLGIDYDKITAETLNGLLIKPTTYSKELGTVTFNYPDESINIYIPDLNNNILHLILTT